MDAPPTRVRGAQFVFWGTAAAVNVAAGLMLAARPDRAAPFLLFRSWTADWLAGGNVYADIMTGVDYPPHAIVALSWLALIPAHIAIALWTAVNVFLAAIAPSLAARVVVTRPRRDHVAFLTLLFLCWGGARVFLQFSLLMLVLGLAAVVLAARRPIVSGVLLGLAMMKPQIAAPFFLWMMFTRRWNVAAVALAVIGGGIAVFCAGAAANPVSVAGQYVAVLRTYYTGNQAMAGEAQLHPLLIHMFQGPFGDLVAGGVAAALLAVIFNEARLSAGRVQLLYAAPALVAVWSLLTFYHLTYGFVLLLPVTALLLLGHVGHQRLRPAVMWTLQIALMADVPGIWRRASLRLPRLEWADAIFLNFDRALMVFLFVGLVALRRNLSQFNDAGSDAL